LAQDVLVALATAVRARPGLDLFLGEELRDMLPSPTPPDARRFGEWHVAVTFEETTRSTLVRLDAVFALKNRAAPPERAIRHYILEADRGTMSLVKRDLHQSSIRRKLLAYAASRREGAFQRFGAGVVRVLMVTTGRERMAGMVALCQALAASGHVSARLFLFVDGEGLLSVPNFLEARWVDGQGQERSIFG
jgi:hypothetical protein